MSSSKIKLKVQHNKHEKQEKQKKTESKQKSKDEKSGAKLGKSKSKQKQQKKPIPEQSEQEDTKLNKSKSKDKKDDKKSDKKDKKSDKKDDKKDKKDQKKQDKKDKKGKQKEDKKGKKDKNDKDKKDKKDKDKKGKKGKNDSEDQDNNKSLKKSKSKSKIDKDKQLETINNINKETKKAKLTIGQLIQQYKQASYDIFINHGHNPEKQRQIEEELERLQKQKERRKRKIESLQKQTEQKKKQKQQERQQKIKMKKQREIQKRKRTISLKLQNLNEMGKKRSEQHQKFKQYCTQRKKILPRYKKYEQQYKQFEQSLKQEAEQIIQQRKLKVAPIDYDELAQFNDQYIQQKMQALQHGQRKLQLQKQIISQQNQWMKNLYKGNNYKNVEKQKTFNLIQMEHSTAKEKLTKIKEYGKLIKSQFIEKDQETDDKTQNHDYESEDVRYREKHVMGKSLGLVPEKKIKPLSHDQKVKMGVEYLQHLRNLPRKGINSSSLPKTIDTPQRIGKTYIMKKASNPYYSLQRSGTSFNAKNPKQIQLAIEQVKSKDFTTALQQKSLHYIQYSDVTDMQKKHLNVNRRLVGDINSKLDILKKLVE